MTIATFFKILVMAIAILTTGHFQSDQSVGKVGDKPIFVLNDANHPALSYDGKHLVVCPEVGTTDVYDIGAGRRLQTFRVPDSADYAISSDGKQVVIFADEIIEIVGSTYRSKNVYWLYDVVSGKALDHGDSKVMRDGIHLGNLQVFNQGGQSSKNFTSDLRLFANLAKRPKKTAPNDLCILLGELKTHQLIRHFGADDYAEMDFWDSETMTPDARILASTRFNGKQRGRNLTVVWDVNTGRELLRIPFYSRFLAMSDDGRRLATDSDKGDRYVAEIWDIATGKRISEVGAARRGKHLKITNGAISPDGKLLATTGNSAVFLLDTDSGRLIAAQEAADKSTGDFIKSVTFSGNGQYIATGSLGEEVKVWRLADVLRDARVSN